MFILVIRPGDGTKMAEYIFTERNGIYIIDLQKTVKMIDEAYYFLVDVARNGGTVLS